MPKLVVHNCTVEFNIPTVDVFKVSNRAGYAKVRIEPMNHVLDTVIRCPDGKVVTIKKMVLVMSGTMLPVLDEQGKQVVLFTMDDEVQPPVADEPVEVT